jgi:hypothetical protein
VTLFDRATAAYHLAVDIESDCRHLVYALRSVLDGDFRDAHCGFWAAGMTAADPAESVHAETRWCLPRQGELFAEVSA